MPRRTKTSPKGKKAKPAPPDDTHIVTRWLKAATLDVGRHALSLFAESDRSDGVIDELRELIRDHYVAPSATAKRLAQLGASETAALLKEYLPTTKKARSGDLGEVLATEVAECHLGYHVPVRRLQWKDGRNMALRGDDIVAIARSGKKKLRFLKGESKSRAALSSTVIGEASAALDTDRGRPTRHTVLFVADRLREQGKDDLATELEKAVLDSFRGFRVEHMLFTLTGSNPKKLLSGHLAECAKKKRRRYAIGIRIKDHAKFIENLFSGL